MIATIIQLRLLRGLLGGGGVITGGAGGSGGGTPSGGSCENGVCSIAGAT